ncbi:MAG TPA: hypothetical protein PLA02_00560 [Brevefilum fermentans]|jgi:hypothetical protein|nr:hypothetical protein [Brevefilum fermentans]HQA27696.1 hypothetical protein [Brevefilum fermentans]
MNDQPDFQEEQTPRPPHYDEITEEQYEKEDQKPAEKAHQDPLSAITWALILIWAGLVFLASNLGWLDRFQPQFNLPGEIEFLGLRTWSVIALGAGIILLFEAIIRTIVPAYRRSTGGSYFLAAILLAIGLNAIFGWQLIWPLVLIGMGLAALANAFFHRRK